MRQAFVFTWVQLGPRLLAGAEASVALSPPPRGAPPPSADRLAADALSDEASPVGPADAVAAATSEASGRSKLSSNGAVMTLTEGRMTADGAVVVPASYGGAFP